jgi:hypothetical protein
MRNLQPRGKGPLCFGRIFGEQRYREFTFEVGQEGVDAIGPDGAVAAPLPHIVDGEELGFVREDVEKCDVPVQGFERVILNGRRRRTLAQLVQPGNFLRNLGLELIDLVHGLENLPLLQSSFAVRKSDNRTQQRR